MGNGPREEADESAATKGLIESGADVAGAVVATALAFLGPEFAIGGAAGGVLMARVLRHVGADIRQRVLGPREHVRIGAVLAFAIVAIKHELDAGRELRTDGFFEARGGRRPPAEEVLEGVLLKARDAYEEKKLPLMGNLYAAIAVDETIGSQHANHLVQLASELTYQQLVFMAVTQDNERRAMLRQASYGAGEALEHMDSNGIGLLTEIYAMHGRGLVRDLTSGTWISVGNVNPGGTRVQGSGGILAKAMKLAESVAPEDKDRVVMALSDRT